MILGIVFYQVSFFVASGPFFLLPFTSVYLQGQHDRTSIAREMSYLKNMHERQSGETFEYDATISCLSDSPHDKTVAEKIASYLETHGKKVVTRSDDAGCWSELAKAQWNIFIMSQDSFKGDQYKIELISAIQRCAANRCIQMLPVITGIRMDEVPNALKWVTMISTEQHNYDEIILDQMEGMYDQGPVVQSIVSLTSSLRAISLTILADSVYNFLKFFAEKM